MKNSYAYKKTIGFLTAAMAFAAAVTACSSSDETSDSSSSVISSSTSSSTAITAEPLASSSINFSKLFSERDREQTYGEITTEITLSGNTAEVKGSGAAVSDGSVTVTAAGIYRITGELNNGQVIVNAPKAKVQLVLDNAAVSCSDAPPVCILDCDKTFITLAENSKNTISDNRAALTEETPDAPDAAIYSKDSLTINGKGSLTVKGGFCDGIHSTDDIVITGGKLDITAENNGIKGKDYVAAAGGEIKLSVKNDGVKATNTEDSSLGFVYIESGSFDITAGGDGIQAETIFAAVGGQINITAGGGSANAPEHKDDFGFGGGFGGGGNKPGFGELPTDENGNFRRPDGGHGGKPDFGEIPTDENGNPQFPGGFGGEGGGMQPPGGFGGGEMPQMPANGTPVSFVSTADVSKSGSSEDKTSTKGIKAGTEIAISGGEFKISAADDTIHSNGTLLISGGKASLDAGDKGIHADKVLEITGSAEVDITKSYEGIEGAVINFSGGKTSVKASDDGINASDGSQQGSMGGDTSGVSLNISGGTLYVDAEGDGIDSNGSLTVTGGTTIVNGPVNGGNGALDANGKILVNGGTLIAAGSSAMAEIPDGSSTQNCVAVGFDTSLSGGTLVTLMGESEVLSFAPTKTFSHIVICTPKIETGKEYTVLTGGKSTAKSENGLFEAGGYDGSGSETGKFTADKTVSTIGTQSSFGGFGGGHGGGGFGGGGGKPGRK